MAPTKLATSEIVPYQKFGIVLSEPDGAWALGGPAGSGRGQTLPGAAHPAQELPGEALLQLAPRPVVSLQSPGRAFASAPRGLLGFPAAGVDDRNHRDVAELIEATVCGSEVSLWPLKVLGGQCGDGLQVRNLTCVVHDASVSVTSKPVENALCGDLPSKESVLQLPCSVPCPGDCHLTEWSEWSSCELTCINGRSFETTGRQSRSRAFIVQSPENQESCSGQVMETRPCSGGKCYDYLWKTSLWRDNVRTVWCQRSDGINVTGGCALRTKPAEVRHCTPACRKPFSYCTQRGVCGCERGYTEIMRSNGLLDYCMKVPGLEDKKADVKTIAGKNKPVNSKMHDIFKGWSIQPFNPDGKLKMWVYGVSAGGFLIIVFLIFTSYLMCKKTKEHQSTPPQQKPLTLAYDGDIDM
nr:PREDICTED: thrombospondin type-1 domain-containing protein 7B-like [Pelecanus crispus]